MGVYPYDGKYSWRDSVGNLIEEEYDEETGLIHRIIITSEGTISESQKRGYGDKRLSTDSLFLDSNWDSHRPK